MYLWLNNVKSSIPTLSPYVLCCIYILYKVRPCCFVVNICLNISNAGSFNFFLLSLTTLLEEMVRFMSKLSNVCFAWNSEHVSRACFRFVTCVHPGEYNDVVTSPYNIAHSLRLLTEHASFVIPVDNKVMYRILTEGDVSPF